MHRKVLMLFTGPSSEELKTLRGYKSAISISGSVSGQGISDGASALILGVGIPSDAKK